VKNQLTPYILLALIVILLLALGSGCRTQGSLGFGRGKSSLKLKISSVLPRDKTDIWAMQGRTFLSEEGQQITLTFPKVDTAERKV
jgi:hypothetical protein